MSISDNLKSLLDEQDECSTGKKYFSKLIKVLNPNNPDDLDSFCEEYTELERAVEIYKEQENEIKSKRKELEHKLAQYTSILSDRLHCDDVHKKSMRGHIFEVFHYRSAKPSFKAKFEPTKSMMMSYPSLIRDKYEWDKTKLIKILSGKDEEWMIPQAEEIGTLDFKEKLRIRNLRAIRDEFK